MTRRNRSKPAENTPGGWPGNHVPTSGDVVSSPAISAGRFSGGAIIPALALLLLVAVAAYHNSFTGPFIFDDARWISENPSIRHLWPIWAVLFPPDATVVGGRLVVSLTLALNYALGGTNVWGYHAFNLVIHILAAWTLFGVLRRTLILPRLRERFGSAATPLALAAAILWMIHPLQTESVTYVIQRTEALMGLFYLLVLYGVIRGATWGGSRWWYVVAVLSCLLGMATKEVTVTAPVIVLVYDRMFLAGTFREAWRQRYGLYLALAATWSVVPLLLISTGFYGGTTGFGVQKFTWWTYLLTQPGVLVHYLGLTFWPRGLCLDYGWPAAHGWNDVLGPAVLMVGLLALTFWALVRGWGWGFLGVWFFLVLAPTSSFVPIQDAAFEHRMYLPLAAVVTGVVLGGYLVGQGVVGGGKISGPVVQIMGVSLLILAGAALGILTLRRNEDYRSELSIWEDTVAKAPGNERAENYLGNALYGCRRTDEAIAHYQKALEIDPDYPAAYLNLGVAVCGQGHVVEAMAYYQKALKIRPDYAAAHNNLGLALAGRGQIDEAITHYQKALKLQPDNAAVHNNLGIALAGSGRFDEAIAHFQEALQLDPKFVVVRDNLGVARSQWEGILKALAGRRELLQSRRDDLALLNDIAWTLATNPNASIRNGAEAIKLAQRAVQLSDRREPAILGTLAAACAEAGRFSEAVQTAHQALDLATEQNKQSLAESLRAKIPLYEAGTPFRETPPSPLGSTQR